MTRDEFQRLMSAEFEKIVAINNILYLFLLRGLVEESRSTI